MSNSKGNTGNSNVGNFNAGSSNVGDFNSGDFNLGDFNSGRYNSGSFNCGDSNVGENNTGNSNIGDFNSGNFNAGDFNSGEYNTGDFNAGNFNIGNHNVGDFNYTSYSIGCFNTENDTKISLFNKLSEWNYMEWAQSEAAKILSKMPRPIIENEEDNTTESEVDLCFPWKTTDCPKKFDTMRLNSMRQSWWDSLEDNEKEVVLNLPNFDAEIFEKTTGIDTNAPKINT